MPPGRRGTSALPVWFVGRWQSGSFALPDGRAALPRRRGGGAPPPYRFGFVGRWAKPALPYRIAVGRRCRAAGRRAPPPYRLDFVGRWQSGSFALPDRGRAALPCRRGGGAPPPYRFGLLDDGKAAALPYRMVGRRCSAPPGRRAPTSPYRFGFVGRWQSGSFALPDGRAALLRRRAEEHLRPTGLVCWTMAKRQLCPTGSR